MPAAFPTCGSRSPTRTGDSSGRLDARGHAPRAADRDDAGRRQHAAQPRRGSRAALAQAGRVGVHAPRPGADHRRGRARAQLRRRRRRGRPVVLPGRHPPLDPALEEGCEFLLVFDDGAFSEESTFLVATGSRTPRAMFWPRTSACPRRRSTRSRTTSATSSPRPFRAGRPRRLRRPARADARSPGSAIGCWPRSRSARPAARSGSSIRPTSPSPRRSPPRSSRSSRARCASCTGTPMP
jgi:hypothetical protein